MSLTVHIEFKDSYYKKINHKAVVTAEQNTIKKTTLGAEVGCKTECPVDTGALKRGHSSQINPDEGLVINRMEYAPWVIHGTRYQSANNYPSRVMKNLASQQFASKTFKQELQKQGVLG
jgi:hypothetical protein